MAQGVLRCLATVFGRVVLLGEVPIFMFMARFWRSACRFKGWLLNQSSWRVKDQLRKRAKGGQSLRPSGSDGSRGLLSDDTGRTATLERVPDPSGANLDALFEMEWRKNLLGAALE